MSTHLGKRLVPRPLTESIPTTSEPRTYHAHVIDAPGRRASSVGPAAPGAANPNDSARLRIVLRRCWRSALLAAVTCSVLAMAAAYTLVPAKYTAYALLHVSPSTPKVLMDTENYSGDYAAYRRTQAALIKSRLVLRNVINRPEVKQLKLLAGKQDPEPWLEKEIRVDPTLGPEILLVGMSGDNPEELAVLVNAVTDGYLKEIVNRDRSRREARLRHLEAVHKYYEENLREARRNLQKAGETDNGDPRAMAMTQQLAMDRLSGAEKELMQVQSELNRLNTEHRLREEERKQASKYVPLESEVDTLLEEQLRTDPFAQQQLSQVPQIQDDIGRILQVAVLGENDPQIANQRAKLKLVDQAVQERRKALRPVVLRKLQDKNAQEKEVLIAQLQQRIRVSQELEKSLTSRIKHLGEEAFSLNRSPANLAMLRDEIAQADNMTKKIGFEIQALQVELGAPPRVNLLEAAETPKVRDTKRQGQAVLIAGLGALALAGYGVVWRALRSQIVYSAEDVPLLGLRLLGCVPPLPAITTRNRDGSASLHEGYLQGSSADVLDVVCLLVNHALSGKNHQAVLVSGTSGADGQAKLASHLAASMARNGHRTLLLDAGVQKGCLHEEFSLPLEPGLGDLLRMQGDIPERLWSDVVHSTAIEDLFIISAGTWDQNTSRLLTRGGLRSILAELKARFDYVVVVGPPVSRGAEGLAVLRFVDGLVVSLLCGVSQSTEMARVLQKANAMGVPILGTVLAGVQPEDCQAFEDDDDIAAQLAMGDEPVNEPKSLHAEPPAPPRVPAQGAAG